MNDKVYTQTDMLHLNDALLMQRNVGRVLVGCDTRYVNSVVDGTFPEIRLGRAPGLINSYLHRTSSEEDVGCYPRLGNIYLDKR